jgi:hypothetical protein
LQRAVLATIAVLTLAAGCSPPPSTGGTPVATTGETYRYTRSEVGWLLGGSGRYMVLAPQDREIWIAADGSGRLKVTRHNPVFFGQNDRAEWAHQTVAGVADDARMPGQLGYTDLSSVPTEPTALRAAIIAGIDRTAPDGESDDYDVLKAARDYLWETVPPVALRRAIFDMLMASPGIPHRAARDRLGRSGTAFSIDSSRGTRTRLTTILARDQGLLGEEQTLLDHDDAIDATPPVVIGYATYLDAQLVGTTEDVK